MNTFDKEKLNSCIDNNNIKDLIEYVSEKINIHNERLKLLRIDEFETNKLIIDKNSQFVIILNNSDNKMVCINGITFEEVLYIDNSENIIIDSKLDDTKKIKFIAFEDTCKVFKNTDDSINSFKQITNSNILIIEDNCILNSDDCDYYREIIDNFINNNNYSNMIWVPGNNVNCNTFMISSNGLNEFSNKTLVKEIINKTTRIFNNITEYLTLNYHININGNTGFQFRKIFGSTRIHKDGIHAHHMVSDKNIEEAKIARIASIVICLNDDYEGGEFYFPVQNITVKLKKGQILIFPPYWTHPHLTNDLKNRTYRYTINSWFYENI